MSETGESRRVRAERILSEPQALETICNHIERGGSLVGLCEMWEIREGDLNHWLYDREHPERKLEFDQAFLRADHKLTHEILVELKRIATIDIRKLYDEDGIMLLPHKWPAELGTAVISLDTYEQFSSDGQKVGQTRKVKFSDKIKAIELIGKKLSLFIEKVEHSGSFKFEDLVGLSKENGKA